VSEAAAALLFLHSSQPPIAHMDIKVWVMRVVCS